MRKPVRTLHYGLGAIGSLIANLAAKRRDVEIVGAVDIAEDKVGRDLGELAGLGRPLGVTVRPSLEEALQGREADVVIHSTGSRLERVSPQLEEILSAGLNVISTCEELAYPWRRHPEIAARLDELAHRKGVRILGTGVNPGFIMDTIALALSGISADVRSIRAVRIVDAAKRRWQLQRKVGAGLTPEEFKTGVQDGTLGHVGLPESIDMIAAALGWELDGVEESIEPVTAQSTLSSSYVTVRPGQVAGLRQTGWGKKDGEAVITLELEIRLGADETGDRVIIEGHPALEMTIRGVHGDIATAAIVLNAIPSLLTSPPGLRTMIDLPLVHWRSPSR